MVIFALIIGVGVLVEFCAVMAAPMGYQDETGFHTCETDSETADQEALSYNPS